MTHDSDIRVGKPDVDPALPSHTPGVREGNSRGHYRRQDGHGPGDRSTARRSTGIRADQRDPVVPGAPNISPP